MAASKRPLRRSCAQDASDASPSKVLRKSDWAHGICLFVVPLGSATTSRRTIWEREVTAAGGCLANSPSSATHLVITPEVTAVRLGAWASKTIQGKGEGDSKDPLSVLRAFAESLESIWVYSDWLVTCLAKQSRVSEESFTWSRHASEHGEHGHDAVSVVQECSVVDATQPTVGKPLAGLGSTPLLARSPAPTPRESDSEVEEVLPKLGAFGGEMTPKRAYLIRNRDKFACQRGGENSPEKGTAGSPPKPRNAELVAMFSRLQQHYESLGDGWRERSYRLTASILRSLSFEVGSEADLDRPELKRLGRKTRDKLKEFLQTGSIGRVEGLQTDEVAKALGELQGIWGVGLTTARRWLGSGCRTISDVRQRVQEGSLRLTADQTIGLHFFEEFSERIPRTEVEEIVAVVRAAVSQRFGSHLRMEACGSFRRGKTSCGDVDLLLCARNARDELSLGSMHDILACLVADLRGQGFITHDLKGGNPNHGRQTGNGQDANESEELRSSSAATYFGVCRLPRAGSLHRRIDIKVYPVLEFPFALLSFTGSGPFNRSMRLFARRAGFSLSDHSICRATHARGAGRGERIWTGPPIAAARFASEGDIFEFLGLAYREPWQREVDASWLAETGTDKAAGNETIHQSSQVSLSPPTPVEEREPAKQGFSAEVQSLLDSDEETFCTEENAFRWLLRVLTSYLRAWA